jgi:Tfp pilus assembly protein PilX
METKLKDDGVVLLIVVFVVALLSAVVIGMLQLDTEEIQIVQNQISAAQAVATAEAGLNDALARIRADSDPNIGYEYFNGGSYAVEVNEDVVTSTGVTADGFIARVVADITVGSASPHIIRIDNLRINE